MLLTQPALTADDATSTALLNCLIREFCAPEDQVRATLGHLIARLPRVGVTLRTRLPRPPVGPVFRTTGLIEECRPGGHWIPVDWRRLANLIAGELELATGEANPEFVNQIEDSHGALTALLSARSGASAHDTTPADPGGAFLRSEQSLVAGHRFHPSPKARQGTPDEWLPYAPEARTRFRLQWLAVRSELAVSEGDLTGLTTLGPRVPHGYSLLPAHPWQFSLLADRPLLRRALSSGALLDLGVVGPEVVPTSSVRTVYVPDADLFCKFSLDVRITNCVRKNAWYELTGAVTLNRLLQPVFGALGARFGGCVMLAEPAYRTVALADRRLYEGLGVIVRQGIGTALGTPLLAAALADPYSATLSGLPVMGTAEGALAWWEAYVRRVAPPALHAYLAYGVVLEPHLQNVLVAVADNGMPIQALFRDLEGTKLVAGHWAAMLGAVPPRVREALTYGAGRGWNRVVYCLFVNHLAEVAATVADLHPELAPSLWPVARQVISEYVHDHLPESHPQTPRMRTLLAGVPLPAKANLRARWSRSPDRAATYVTVPNPMATPIPDQPAPETTEYAQLSS